MIHRNEETVHVSRAGLYRQILFVTNNKYLNVKCISASFCPQVLDKVINMKLQVFMNCRAKLSEMPLKR